MHFDRSNLAQGSLPGVEWVGEQPVSEQLAPLVSDGDGIRRLILDEPTSFYLMAFDVVDICWTDGHTNLVVWETPIVVDNERSRRRQFDGRRHITSASDVISSGKFYSLLLSVAVGLTVELLSVRVLTLCFFRRLIQVQNVKRLLSD